MTTNMAYQAKHPICVKAPYTSVRVDWKTGKCKACGFQIQVAV